MIDAAAIEAMKPITTKRQADVLAVVSLDGTVTAGQVSARLMLTNDSARMTLRNLVRYELLEEADRTERGGRRYQITALGEEVLKRVPKEWLP